MDSKQLSTASLLSLPLEIRIKVYHTLFAGRTLPVCKSNASAQSKSKWSMIDDQDWAILLTCKQIHAEALPEYFRVAEFCGNRTTTAFTNASRIPVFRKHVRNLTFEPFKSFPAAQDLFNFSELTVLKMVNLRAFEPLGMGSRSGAQYNPLSHNTLLLAAKQANQIHWPDPEPVAQMKELEEQLLALYAESPDQHRNRLHFILRYNYSYAEKIDHPDGWGGMTPKQMTVIDYDQTENIFTFEATTNGRQQRVIIRPDF